MRSYQYLLLAAGWAAWLAPFVMTGWHSSSTTVRDSRGLWGILLQMVGYSVLWQGRFWLRRPEDWQVWLSAALLALAVLLSWTGARALGRHLRFEAALRTNHKLVQTGPYRFIRHPIYASMLCLLLGTGVMIASPLLFAIALVILIAGTEIRVRTEDRLLAEHFGPDFVAYRRRVPAYIPLVR